MKTQLTTLALAATLALTASCTGKSAERQAAELLEQAQTMADKGDYAGAAVMIDSLRKHCPTAVEGRKAALKLHQQISLKAAQQTVEAADKALQTADSEYNAMKNRVDSLKNLGVATAEQLTGVTLLRMKRDSLQTVFDVECAKIKYIRAKMKE